MPAAHGAIIGMTEPIRVYFPKRPLYLMRQPFGAGFFFPRKDHDGLSK